LMRGGKGAEKWHTPFDQWHANPLQCAFHRQSPRACQQTFPPSLDWFSSCHGVGGMLWHLQEAFH
jgi:hypothetical protein